MHYTDAIKIAKLGANILIGKESKIHYTDAIKIVEKVVEKGGLITIEKEYHHTDIEKMVKIAGNRITIAI
ncbi:hypothetical protein ACFFUS_00025 [Vibrio gallaecicus]|uniref:hypothetical protein n=1 Tax=Vibrio gallaecicus TaxID=552386 RepID=UPI0010C9FDEF|nr:hypothetical protein [Vibrio gallaecicus]MDN3617303.1 hypothetical protein [Vibrio gallaecicus]